MPPSPQHTDVWCAAVALKGRLRPPGDSSPLGKLIHTKPHGWRHLHRLSARGLRGAGHGRAAAGATGVPARGAASEPPGHRPPCPPAVDTGAVWAARRAGGCCGTAAAAAAATHLHALHRCGLAAVVEPHHKHVDLRRPAGAFQQRCAFGCCGAATGAPMRRHRDAGPSRSAASSVAPPEARTFLPPWPSRSSRRWNSPMAATLRRARVPPPRAADSWLTAQLSDTAFGLRLNRR